MKRIIIRAILAIAIIAGILYGISMIAYTMHHEQTDDAQLEGNINPIIPKIAGYITSLRIDDNQLVSKGDTLFTIDDRDLRNKLLQAEAAYNNALANLEVMRSNAVVAKAFIAVTQAGQQASEAAIGSAKAKLWKAEKDFKRYTNLLVADAATEQQVDHAKADKEIAESELMQLERQHLAAANQTSAAKIEATGKTKQITVAAAIVEQRKADLEFAKLQLSYTVITAPSNGYVFRKSIQLGQYINAGQTLFSVIDNSGLWVVANFKETQLVNMKVGDAVEIEVDAFKGKPLKGVVTSIARATGARFSLLPPDNATGNFVKVVQRVPVKILITEQAAILQKLGPGMSVKVSVAI
jgi:membrane fusion protein (multidrug efflux system)